MPLYFPRISLSQAKQRTKPSSEGPHFSLRANSKNDVVLSVRTADNKLIHLPVERDPQTNNYFVRPPESGTIFHHALPKIFNKPIQEDQLTDVIRDHVTKPGRHTWYESNLDPVRTTPIRKEGLNSSLAKPFEKAKNLTQKAAKNIRATVKKLSGKSVKKTAVEKVAEKNFLAQTTLEPKLTGYLPSQGIWKEGQIGSHVTPDDFRSTEAAPPASLGSPYPPAGTKVKSRR